MRYAVFGANGMAGHMVALYLQERGHDVTAYSRRPVPFGIHQNIICDLYDANTYRPSLLEGSFDSVINCVGVLNKMADASMSNAIFLNSYFPHLLAEILLPTITRLVHLSTDCVFSGSTGHYTERCETDGRKIYDRTKALGEVNDNKNLTFRTSIIGPDINADGIGLFNWFMLQKNSLQGYRKAIWTGVTTLTLAKAIEKADEDRLTGLYHLVNNHTINKYELCSLFNHYFKDGKTIIEPVDNFIIDKSLVCTRTDFGFKVPSYAEMIEDIKTWVDGHSWLYPHYFV